MRSRRSLLLAAVGLLVTALLVTEFVVFVKPPTSQARPVDVVAVLGGGDFTARKQVGIDVAGLRPGTILMFSLNDPSACPWKQYLPQFEVICFRADPATTQGEARYVTALARRRGAGSIAVVTSADQLLRARLRFSRCWDGELRMVEAPSSTLGVIARVPYQTMAMLKALVLQRSC
ncbi:hypothetical protein SAMN05444157_1560 [Frankineae bacterium MT45]|nr:hypothetical protein SAMN05444157_1560 [Frankineae bacterium MT45]